MKLNTDKTVLDLSISGPHDAQALDALLYQLAKLRAQMAPAVPKNRKDLDETTLSLMEIHPELHISHLESGEIRLRLRHRGFGWQAYQLTAHSAAGAARFIASKTGDVETVDFIGQKHGNGH